MKLQRIMILGSMALAIGLFTACSGEDGENGLPGPSGANCWDAVGDVNQDGTLDALDCIGKAGSDGNGNDGINCWDLNGNGQGDSDPDKPDEDEDINGDGEFNALDCVGQSGGDGNDGDNGISCWDLNGNGQGDITNNDETNEDVNGDGFVNTSDCQGRQGLQGDDGNANVQQFKINLSPFIVDTNVHTFQVPEFTEEFIENHAFIFYLKDDDTGVYLPIPGGILATGRRYQPIIDVGEVTLQVSRWSDGSEFGPGSGWLEIFEWLYIYAIESNVLNKSGHTDPIKALKAAGVDINDHSAVMAYLGLKE